MPDDARDLADLRHDLKHIITPLMAKMIETITDLDAELKRLKAGDGPPAVALTGPEPAAADRGGDGREAYLELALARVAGAIVHSGPEASRIAFGLKRIANEHPEHRHLVLEAINLIGVAATASGVMRAAFPEVAPAAAPTISDVR